MRYEHTATSQFGSVKRPRHYGDFSNRHRKNKFKSAYGGVLSDLESLVSPPAVVAGAAAPTPSSANSWSLFVSTYPLYIAAAVVAVIGGIILLKKK